METVCSSEMLVLTYHLLVCTMSYATVRSFAADTMSESCGYCLLFAVVPRGAEGHMYCNSDLLGWYETRHVAYDAVWSGNVYRPDCMTSVYGHYHRRKKPDA
jgi:hypothetical protein